ncbi:hypothetical protein BN59_01280 [Legionella massiliensis]|uniref:Uncharacterized protein n=1 Tax=Legionella massiliensis TaxID=1034943 RepID=A0A078KVJ0_9GAMM|nr:hypothetical protein [Legionella massiliensis]CDZ77001.1 hypothetical protein BN59_01280 [Legionella massiliensis]CEE12739.1 hypothetical protein BN1094_01280 [Legionella massiliensis]
MSWSQRKKEFLDKINENAPSLLNPGLLVQRRSLYEKFNKGKKFMLSLEELRSLLYPTNDYFWEGFLRSATQVLNENSEANYIEFYGYLSRLKHEMNSHSNSNRSWGGLNTVVYSLYTVAAGTTFVSGAMLLDCVIAGTCALAMGPWGAAALGVGFMLLGAIVATYTAYQVYKNFRLCRDSQLKEVEDFVNHLDPQPDTERSEVPIDVSLFIDEQVIYMVPAFGAY